MKKRHHQKRPQRAQARENQQVYRKIRLDEIAEAALVKLAQRERARSLLEGLLEADATYRDQSVDGLISMSSVASGLREIGASKSEWAGIPMPLNGESLVIEPGYPYAKAWDKINEATMAPQLPQLRTCRNVDVDDTTAIVNRFWSVKYNSEITIWKQQGKYHWGLIPGIHHLGMDLQTLGCADAWSLETELRAMETLNSLVTHRQMRQYFLTGTFVESSKRSGVFYIFRRLRPTVAMSGSSGEMKILCTLCLHPIAYYSGTWAGAMCPTDDVLAHLMLMRGDESMLWRRANQHAAYRPEAGL